MSANSSKERGVSDRYNSSTNHHSSSSPKS